MQPFDRIYQLRCKLDAFGVDFKALVIDLALSGHDIQIAARCLGVENGSVVVLELFEAAEPALVAS
jgi:hypothetical protein